MKTATSDDKSLKATQLKIVNKLRIQLADDKFQATSILNLENHQSKLEAETKTLEDKK